MVEEEDLKVEKVEKNEEQGEKRDDKKRKSWESHHADNNLCKELCQGNRAYYPIKKKGDEYSRLITEV